MEGKITAERLVEEIIRQKPQAILMRGNPPFSLDVLEHAEGLRVIAKHGSGVDTVDLGAATARGIAVMVAGDANAPAVAEHTIALILSLGRDLVTLDRRVREGKWDRDGYKGREIAGRTIGIIGFGRVGRRVAAAASYLGLTVLVLTRHAEAVDPAIARVADDLQSLLCQSDIISLHVPLTEQTHGMIDRDALAMMQPGSLLINTSRGALVDETALAEALIGGHLAAAAVDTLSQEPPPADCPLLHAPNLLLTPHIAGMTADAIVRMGIGAAENIVSVLTGRSIISDNVVNPEVFERRQGSSN